MKVSGKSVSLLTLIIPLSAALLVLCVTAGYVMHFVARERAYQRKWKEYQDCGLA